MHKNTIIITPSGSTFGMSTFDADEWDERFKRRWPDSEVIITKCVDAADEIRIIKYGLMLP